VRRRGRDVPGQQLVQPVRRVRADAGNDLAQVGLRLHAVERGGPDQGVERAARSPPASLPAKSQFFLPRATGLMAFSAALLLISNRP
jgi:hypothetical protein